MSSQPDLVLWAGAECTINRVGDRFFDQYELSGHRRRLEADFEQFRALGLRTFRVGLQWEHHARTGSWADFDHLLSTMQQLDLQPIGGLLHHGSGPPETDLLDPAFPPKLAAYAHSVAQRYPGLLDYTPVNEPHTTARFSCLYGHWYPHHRSMRSYVRAFFHQLQGIVLSMEAIRSVQPAARLIHTEDSGVTFSTPPLEAFRQEREHRRWLGTDLLCGLVTRHHPLFSFLQTHGLSERQIFWFLDHPCPPSILGLNHYVTSDRYLDHRLALYPGFLAGGDSGTEPLVDVEAVRVRAEGIVGTEAILTEAWQRYGLPVAITEAHLGDEPADQRRWLAGVWRGAQAAKAAGADVRAVTVWALLGSYNWCNLCTENSGSYEAGVFTVHPTAAAVTATPLAELVHQLAATGTAPALDEAGELPWWQHSSRLSFPVWEPSAGSADTQSDAAPEAPQEASLVTT